MNELHVNLLLLGYHVKARTTTAPREPNGLCVTVFPMSMNILLLALVAGLIPAGAIAQVLPVTSKHTCPPGSKRVGESPPEGKRLGCETAEGQKVGVWTEWFDSGQMRQRGQFVKGEEQGPWIQWHANGVIRLEGTFQAGVLNGVMRSYYTSGVLNEEGKWNNGKAHGQAAKARADDDGLSNVCKKGIPPTTVT